MQATESNFLQFLKAPKQFAIPIYQRPYSWTQKQCQQLWSDILRAAKDESVTGHFIGSIVYIEKGIYQVASVPQLLVIDGQQRLTTLSLLLAALGKIIEERKAEADISRRRINNYFLFNSEEEGELYYKLQLTQGDRQTFINVVEGGDMPEDASYRIIENHRFFEDQIRRATLDPNDIYKGISKLIIVDISLDRDRDNPQLIFESLNSTGLDLTQADLIRNYVLMGLESKEQAEVYRKYWHPMEQGFGHAEYAGQFDRFMRDYLTIKTGRIPNINEVYASFKSYVQGQKQATMEEIVADIYRYSKYFVRLAFLKDSDKEINAVLADINTLKVDVAYPFLLQVYDDYERSTITRDDFISVLKLVESYVFRRAVCGIPTNSLNKTFTSLASEIDKADYLRSARAAFLLKDSYKRLPGDEEFRREFVVKDFYNFRSRNYLLRKLENHDRKERVDVEGYTIEHVMPQNENLSTEWRQELGAEWEHVQAKYLHTIGNLTLTGYNPELSDRAFREKRDMKGGFADSPLRLNRSLAKLEHWNEEEIVKRANTLADLAIQVWAAPSLPAETLERFRRHRAVEGGRAYSLADHEGNLKGSRLELFEAIRKRILNLSSAVREEVRKHYIAYKAATNFVDIEPQKNRLKFVLNMAFDEVDDPEKICRDVSNVGHYGNGDVEFSVTTPDQIEYAMSLVRQSFEKQREDVEV
ncbi:DUF262 and DUF1524 domain-containing protein [Tautonia sp. JC769]|uniref:DUF262 and DUF1524 domain-containing protein n=1 Tax=Tautonia sp. JC769 TaxID=3232135 RepID=UPI00345B0379